MPFERLNIDFKGPLPSTNRNKYFLNVVDEFSRFPFVIPVPDMTSSTVISSLCTLFTTFGMPSMIHSDRGSSLISHELKQFLTSKGISTSRTTPYHPIGNGQVEKMNHTVWRAVTLSLRSKKLPQSRWQEVLPDVLHSIQTLLCTATNCTPHERLFTFQRRSGSGTSLLLGCWNLVKYSYVGLSDTASRNLWWMRWSYWNQIHIMPTLGSLMVVRPQFL